jgi:hypothetical protein
MKPRLSAAPLATSKGQREIAAGSVNRGHSMGLGACLGRGAAPVELDLLASRMALQCDGSGDACTTRERAR